MLRTLQDLVWNFFPVKALNCIHFNSDMTEELSTLGIWDTPLSRNTREGMRLQTFFICI